MLAPAIDEKIRPCKNRIKQTIEHIMEGNTERKTNPIHIEFQYCNKRPQHKEQFKRMEHKPGFLQAKFVARLTKNAEVKTFQSVFPDIVNKMIRVNQGT